MAGVGGGVVVDAVEGVQVVKGSGNNAVRAGRGKDMEAEGVGKTPTRGGPAEAAEGVVGGDVGRGRV